MFCTKCGREIKEETFEFCPICGTPVYKEEIKEPKRDITDEPKVEDGPIRATISDKEVTDEKVVRPTNDISQEKAKVVEEKSSRIEPAKRQKPSIDLKRILPVAGGILLAVAVVIFLVKIITKPKEVDITHGGEEEYIASTDFEWRFDYNWAEYDEEWDKISSTSEIDVLADIVLESDDLGDSIGDEVAKNYIESRLKPIHYAKDSYWDFCPEEKVEHAEEMWKEYLKDHKELRGMYIVIRDEKYYPYADADFDKDVFMNPYTATKVLSTSGEALTGEDYDIPEEGMGIIEYNPFDFMTVSFNGLSKRAKAEMNYTGSYLTANDFEISQTDHLSNGDEITVSVIDPEVAANYGCELLQTEETYTVEGLDECVEPEDMTTDELAYFLNEIMVKIADDENRLSLTDKEMHLTFAASIAFSAPYSDSEPLNKMFYIYKEDLRSKGVLPHRYFYVVEVDEFVREASGGYHINDIHLKGSSFLPQGNGEIYAVESTDEIWTKYIHPEFEKYENETQNYEMALFDGVPINSAVEINNDGRDTIWNFTKDYASCYVEKLKEKHEKWTITEPQLFETRAYRKDDGTTDVAMIMLFFVDNNAQSASSHWAVEVYMPILFENVAFDDNACIMYSRCLGEDYASGVSHSFPHASGDVRGYLSLEDMEAGLAKTYPIDWILN